jgi:hypothetical protein
MREVDPTGTGRGSGGAGGVVLSEVLSSEWRRNHVEKGDDAMSNVYNHLANPVGISHTAIEVAGLYVAIAQAHYLAANVRARPDVTA